MLPLTWCACYFPKIIILRFEVISEKIRKNPVNTEKTFSMYYTVRLSVDQPFLLARKPDGVRTGLQTRQ
jgi:hypothetical protein